MCHAERGQHLAARPWFPHATNPRALGFDAAYEIPSNITPQKVEHPDRSAFAFTGEFDGRIIDYHKFAEFHANRPFPEYKRFKTVMAPWDNTARYRAKAMVHVNTGNDAYRLWITKAYLDTYRRHAGEERLIFLHSWNEWCEGTYIEPDGRHGRKYLEETRGGVSDAICVIRGAQKAGLDLDAASLVNRIGREREEAYRVIFKSMRAEADNAWGEAGHANNHCFSVKMEAQELRAELEAARCEASRWHDEVLGNAAFHLLARDAAVARGEGDAAECLAAPATWVSRRQCPPRTDSSTRACCRRRRRCRAATDGF